MHDNKKIERFYTNSYSQVRSEINEIEKNIKDNDFLNETMKNDYGYLKNCAIRILNERTGFYRGINEWEKCESDFKELYKLLDEVGEGGTVNHAVIMLNEATTMSIRGMTEEAESLFRQCYHMLNDNSDVNDYVWASFYNNRATLYLDMGSPEKALEDQKIAVSYLEKSVGLNRRGAAITYSSMAASCEMLGRLDEGEKYADKAIKIFEAIGGDPHFGAAINVKGLICYRRGKYQEAADLFLKAAEETEIYFGKNIEYMTSMRNREKALKSLEETEGNQDTGK